MVFSNIDQEYLNMLYFSCLSEENHRTYTMLKGVARNSCLLLKDCFRDCKSDSKRYLIFMNAGIYHILLCDFLYVLFHLVFVHRKEIQMGTAGHCAEEDARTTMELVLLKLKIG